MGSAFTISLISSTRHPRLLLLLGLLAQYPKIDTMVRSCLLEGLLALAISTAVTVPYVAAQEGDFSNPGNLYRPRFRYWQVLMPTRFVPVCSLADQTTQAP